MKIILLMMFFVALIVLAGCKDGSLTYDSAGLNTINNNLETIISNQEAINNNIKIQGDNMQIIVDNQNKQQENLKIMQDNIINNCKVR